MNNNERLTIDTRPESISTFTETYTPEGGTEQTATYKSINAHPIIGGILDKFAFLRTHASAVWYNKLAGKTVRDKFDEVDAAVEGAMGQIQGVVAVKSFMQFSSPFSGTAVYGNDSIFQTNQFMLTISQLNSLQKLNALGSTYRVLAKKDNANPFNLPINGYTTRNLWIPAFENGNIYPATAYLVIYYDGVNTYYGINTNFTDEATVNTTMVLPRWTEPYNSQPK